MCKWIKSLFNQSNYQNRLEAFVTANKPTGIHDVERLVKQFEERNFGGLHGR